MPRTIIDTLMRPNRPLCDDDIARLDKYYATLNRKEAKQRLCEYNDIKARYESRCAYKGG